ncbi:DENN domain-containing protein 1A isoform X3 [Histomonas meleagridis]|uniref:DENN domain-containing protein 1A isoform X3 n=1 Tax=Histomonas meleagridis TaxID=135588 RepID=UPI00355A3BBE|nr:DENN domain-containing protein 1A isoform X3 [Histomonas meleagridis]KAH0799556.1 DENN domain-containing protein 1A isoform X3 [Histomonas meleagridis]
MLSFLTDQDPLFEYIYYVEEGSDSEPVSIYQKTEEVPESISKNLKTFCFPFNDNDRIGNNEQQFTFAFTDADRKLLFTFVHYHIADDNKIHAYCLISPKYHPELYTEIISNISGLKGNEQKDYISEVLNLKINVSPHDNVLDSTAASLVNIKSIDHLSPSSELMKIYSYLLSKFIISDLLHCIIAILFDYRILVISSSPKVLGETAFSLLGLVYPLSWPGSFIPILPTAIQTALEAPFAFIIGLHSSLSLNLLSDNRYFVLNADVRYTCPVGIEDLPQNLHDLIDRTSESIRKTLKKYMPILPFKKVQRKFHKFIVNFMGEVYSVDPKQPQQIYNSFNTWKSKNTNDLPSILSQTQFIDQFMRLCFIEKDQVLYDTFFGVTNTSTTKQPTNPTTANQAVTFEKPPLPHDRHHDSFDGKSFSIDRLNIPIQRRTKSIIEMSAPPLVAERKRKRKHHTSTSTTDGSAETPIRHHRKHHKRSSLSMEQGIEVAEQVNLHLRSRNLSMCSGMTPTKGLLESNNDSPVAHEEQQIS